MSEAAASATNITSASAGDIANPAPVLTLCLHRRAQLGWRYRLAGLDLLCDHPLSELETVTAVRQAAPAPTVFEPRAGHRVFHDQAWVGGSQLRLATWWDGDRCWIELADQAAIGIDRSTGNLWVFRRHPHPDPRWLEHCLLGPPLLLGLASRGTFALHASAIDVEGQLALVVGPSGAGKSTLAAAARDGCKRWADDLVPVALGDRELVAWAGFPQLKLSRSQRRRLLLGPGQRPVAAVFILQPARATDPPRCTRWTGIEAAAAWLRHTMVSRLFDSTLLESHLDFVAEASRRVPTFGLRVPRDRRRLGEVQRLLEQTLAA